MGKKKQQLDKMFKEVQKRLMETLQAPSVFSPSFEETMAQSVQAQIPLPKPAMLPPPEQQYAVTYYTSSGLNKKAVFMPVPEPAPVKEPELVEPGQRRVRVGKN